MPGHQEFTALSSEEAEQASAHVADMQKWAREAYLSTKHVEDIEPIWLKYFEAEHELHAAAKSHSLIAKVHERAGSVHNVNGRSHRRQHGARQIEKQRDA